MAITPPTFDLVDTPYAASGLVMNHLQNFVVISICYVIAFSLTFGFVFPLQQLILANVATQVGLLFIPHGVRVIILYYYGWRAVIYLLPASYLMYFLSSGQTGQDIYAPLVSLLGCYVGIQLVRLMLVDTNTKSLNVRAWKLLFTAGAVASVFNSFGLTAMQNGLSEMTFLALKLNFLGYIIGDMLGMMLCVATIMLGFRYIRSIKSSA